MPNHHCTGTSMVSVAIVFTLILQPLIVHDVTGFRGQTKLMSSDFNRKIHGESRKARKMTNGTDDVIHIKRDVIVEQVPCPRNCTCSKDSWVTLDCGNKTANAASLSHEIDIYLSSVAWNFDSLLIVNTPLTALPKTVCQLERLTQLQLAGNKLLTRLPDNCFTRLHELRIFGASGNGLMSLQDGLFDNLTKLQAVDVSFNQITSIGAHLFDVTANLPRLHKIILLVNNLTEIDVWITRRAQLIDDLYVEINFISRFINSLGWHYDCNSAPPSSTRWGGTMTATSTRWGGTMTATLRLLHQLAGVAL